MLKILIALAPIFFVSACFSDESISGFVKPTAEYHLVEIDGAPFDGRATISFPELGKVVGRGPCNRYFATQTAPYPWIAIERIGATRMACESLPTEAAYFAALEEMTLSEVSGDTLILSNTAGRQMTFVAR